LEGRNQNRWRKNKYSLDKIKEKRRRLSGENEKLLRNLN
jgi:hypothetical protein